MTASATSPAALEALALRVELQRLEAAAPLSARETARYLEIERRIDLLDAVPHAAFLRAKASEATPHPAEETR